MAAPAARTAGTRRIEASRRRRAYGVGVSGLRRAERHAARDSYAARPRAFAAFAQASDTPPNKNGGGGGARLRAGAVRPSCPLSMCDKDQGVGATAGGFAVRAVMKNGSTQRRKRRAGANGMQRLRPVRANTRERIVAVQEPMRAGESLGIDFFISGSGRCPGRRAAIHGGAETLEEVFFLCFVGNSS